VKGISPDQYTIQSSASFQLTLANPQLPLSPWLERKWYGESSKICQVWTEVVATGVELAGLAADG
jgi:hypothetical protein